MEDCKPPGQSFLPQPCPSVSSGLPLLSLPCQIGIKIPHFFLPYQKGRSGAQPLLLPTLPTSWQGGWLLRRCRYQGLWPFLCRGGPGNQQGAGNQRKICTPSSSGLSLLPLSRQESHPRLSYPFFLAAIIAPIPKPLKKGNLWLIRSSLLNAITARANGFSGE